MENEVVAETAIDNIRKSGEKIEVLIGIGKPCQRFIIFSKAAS